MHRFVPVLATVLLLHTMVRAAPPGGSPPTTQPAAEWARLAPAQWPQLVLTNDATFEGHSPLRGASAFLMRMPDGEVLVGTAKHLIKKSGGVDPPVALPDLDRVLTRWRVFPRTKAEAAVEAKGVVERTTNEAGHDWLLLHLAGTPSKLPATPLTPRERPASVGETVYLVGVSYADRAAAQNVYKGTVTARPGKNYFTYEFSPPVRIAGFSGAPIVDANGLLVGHGVSMSKELKQKDGLEVEFGGEDATLALQLWRRRNDPPATRPADALRLDLPNGWVPKVSKSSNVVKFATYPDLTAYFELVGEPKADFGDDVDLMGWAKLVKANSAKASTLENREETDLKERHVGDRPTVEYEVSGTIKGVKVRYRIVMLESNGYFCKFACWTTPSHWDAAQGKFEDVVKALK